MFLREWWIVRREVGYLAVVSGRFSWASNTYFAELVDGDHKAPSFFRNVLHGRNPAWEIIGIRSNVNPD
jgi:hypothetical protein